MPIIPRQSLTFGPLKKFFSPNADETMGDEPMAPLPYKDMTKMTAKGLTSPEDAQLWEPPPAKTIPAPKARPAAPDFNAIRGLGSGLDFDLSPILRALEGDAMRRWRDATGEVDRQNMQASADSQINNPIDERAKLNAEQRAEMGKVSDDVRAQAAGTNSKYDELSNYFTPQARTQRRDAEDASARTLERTNANQLNVVKAQGDQQRQTESAKQAAARANFEALQKFLTNGSAPDTNFDVDGMFSVTHPGGGGGNSGPKLASGLVERVAGAKTALGVLDRMEKSFKNVSTQGGRWFTGVGPLASRMSDMQNSIPAIPADTQWAEFQSNSATLANSVIKAITGAQMSEQEAVRIMRQIPTGNMKDNGVWQSTAQALRQSLADTISNIGQVNREGAVPVTEDRLRQIAAEMGLDVEDAMAAGAGGDDLGADWGGR